MRVPVTIAGRVVGEAEISADGEIITAELNSGALPRELRDMFLIGHADALSIDAHKFPATQTPLSQEQKSQRWNQRNLPYGL